MCSSSHRARAVALAAAGALAATAIDVLTDPALCGAAWTEFHRPDQS